MSRLRAAFALAAILVLPACGGGGKAAADAPAAAASAPTITVAALTLPALTTAKIAQATHLAASATDRSGAPVAGATLAWSSADPTIASVDATGTVTPVRAGFTTISVSSNGVSASGMVSVRGALALPTRSHYVGTNLSGIAYYSSQFPFADLMKSGGGWSSREDNGTWGAAFPSMTPDGYPASLKPGQHALNAVAWAGSNFKAGRYVVLWDGDGAISFPLSNVTIAETSAHRIAIDVTDTTGSLWVGDRPHQRDRPGEKRPLPLARHRGDLRQRAVQPALPEPDRAVLAAALHGLGRDQRLAGRRVGRPRPRGRRQLGDAGGVPIEVMIDLANTLHVDPWFCMPHQASDDYVRQFATLVHARLDPALHPHIEYSNEVWNTGFAQTTGRPRARRRSASPPVRPAGDLLRHALGADLQAPPGRLRPADNGRHRARARRPGRVG